MPDSEPDEPTTGADRYRMWLDWYDAQFPDDRWLDRDPYDHEFPPPTPIETIDPYPYL